MHLPKCMANVMISDQACGTCESKGRGQVNKVRFDVFFEALDPSKRSEMEQFLD